MELIRPSRRGFLTGLVALVAAPAIIKVADIMPINSKLTTMNYAASFEALVEGLQAEGVWSKLDALYVFEEEYGNGTENLVRRGQAFLDRLIIPAGTLHSGFRLSS